MEAPDLDPVALLATLSILGGVVKAVVDAIRRRFPNVDGFVVQLLAAGLGAGSAWAFDLRGTEALLAISGATVGRIPPAGVDYLITGVAIAAGAGIIAEIAHRHDVELTVETEELEVEADA